MNEGELRSEYVFNPKRVAIDDLLEKAIRDRQVLIPENIPYLRSKVPQYTYPELLMQAKKMLEDSEERQGPLPADRFIQYTRQILTSLRLIKKVHMQPVKISETARIFHLKELIALLEEVIRKEEAANAR